MKINKLFFGMASLFAAMAFTACSSDDAEFQQSALKSNVISLTSSLARTRAASDPQTNALNTDNKVGVFVTSNSVTITNGDNNEHAVGSDGVLSTSNVMNYPAEDGATVDIYAYAPYVSEMALNTNNDFQIATDQSENEGYLASDLVYASKTGQVSSENAVSLTFAHKLSKLNVNIDNASDSEIDLTNAVVSITGTKVATTFNPSTGAVGEASGEATDIKAASALGTGTTACAVIVPQTIGAGSELVKITVDGKTLVAKLASEITFESGTAYNYTVKISKEEVELTLNSTSITDWGRVDLEDAEMEEKTVEVTSPLDATFSIPSSVTNGSWDADTYTYSWTATNNNLITCFEFTNGELSNYSTLTFTLSSFAEDSGMVRMGYYIGSSFTEFGSGFGSAGKKTVTLTDLGIDLSQVTKISFGGRTNTGSVVLTDVQLIK